MKRLEEIFDAMPTPTVQGEETKLEVAGSIEWEHVSFSYFANGLDPRNLGGSVTTNGGDGGSSDPPRWALRDIDVKVPDGGKLAIVGRTGAGKSTMVKLLARLIEPTDGRVLLDGRDIRELPLKALRKTVGMVPQEPMLFSDTIARN